METLEKQNLVNRIKEIYPDHTLWIKEQFNNKKFIYTRGREVIINAPGRNLKRIVNIPSKDDPSYKIAWINVYNLCLDYLEGSINAACIENRFIQRMGNSWALNGHTIFWPKFNPNTADYARGLDKILDEYIYVKTRFIKLHSKRKNGLSISKRSINITGPKELEIIKESKSKIIKKEAPEMNIQKSQIIENKPEDNKIDNEYSKKLDYKYKKVSKKDDTKTELDRNKLKIQKVSDGDILNAKDVKKLRDSSDMVIVTCMNVLNPKEEDIFIKNCYMCNEVGLTTGAFIYGKSTDEKEAAQELKIIVKMLETVNNFSGFVIYSVDNDYILKNKDGDIKLLNIINTYNTIIKTLNKIGYTSFISMNLDSGRIIDDIYRRYNMQKNDDIVYMTIVRDADMLDRNSSSIVIDPWNDFDLVNIKNEVALNILNEKVSKTK